MLGSMIAIAVGATFDGLSTAWFRHYFPGEYETNPILGKYPSNLRIFSTGAAYLAVLLGLQYALHGTGREAIEELTNILAGVHLMAGWQNFARNGSNPFKALIQAFDNL